MELQVGGLTGAARGEKSAGRLARPNGDRDWETRTGTVELPIPTRRTGSGLPGIPEPGRAAEKALTAAIREAYVQGISRRSVNELVRAMGLEGACKSEVSRLWADIDFRVKGFTPARAAGRSSRPA